MFVAFALFELAHNSMRNAFFAQKNSLARVCEIVFFELKIRMVHSKLEEEKVCICGGCLLNKMIV